MKDIKLGLKILLQSVAIVLMIIVAVTQLNHPSYYSSVTLLLWIVIILIQAVRFIEFTEK